MASNVMDETFTEERLFSGVLYGSFEQYGDLLKDISDVDFKGVKNKTLLHIAVKLGKVDWVEGLLERGADPAQKDTDGYSVVDIALEMKSKYPDDANRQQILKLMRIVQRARDAERSKAPCGGGDQPDESSFSNESNYVMRDEVTFTVSRLLREITEVSREVGELKNSLSQLTDSCSLEFSSLSDSVNAVRSELSTIMKGTVDDVRKELSSRDILLSTLESSVTAMADSMCHPKETSSPNKKKSSASVDGRSVPLTEDEIRTDCIDRMMGITQILNEDHSKKLLVRRKFEKLYSTCEITSCLLKFLSCQPDVLLIIDCESRFIDKMKSRVRNRDGIEGSGSGYYCFADFHERKVYLGGKVDEEHTEEWVLGRLTFVLTEMSLFLAFRNRGRPYAEGDDASKHQMKIVIEEAEKNRCTAKEFDMYIRWVLNLKTHLAKEISLASAVPEIIAEYGKRKGTEVLQAQVPSMLKFYNEKVMPTLLSLSEQ